MDCSISPEESPRPTVPKICFRLGAPTNFDRSAVLIVRFICHWQRSQTNHLLHHPTITQVIQRKSLEIKGFFAFMEQNQQGKPVNYYRFALFFIYSYFEFSRSSVNFRGVWFVFSEYKEFSRSTRNEFILFQSHILFCRH